MQSHRGFRAALAALGLGLAAACAATPVPAPRRVGTLVVQRYGDHGRPVILIPGLQCGPWEWRRTIADLEKSHVVYALTLAGFDGVPAPTPDAQAGNLLDRADASLLQLIEREHIDKPVLVGHSIGGTLALRFAGEHAKLIAGVVAVEGLPVFPGMERMSAAQRQAIATRMRAKIAAMSPAQSRAADLAYMQHVGVIDPRLAARDAARVERSDAQAAADYMAADLAADYRPGMRKADVPILEIAPYYAPDAAAMGRKPVPTAAQKAAYYRSLLGDAPDAKVVSIAPARHFAMLDQPAQFRQVLDGFLVTLRGPRDAALRQ